MEKMLSMGRFKILEEKKCTLFTIFGKHRGISFMIVINEMSSFVFIRKESGMFRQLYNLI